MSAPDATQDSGQDIVIDVHGLTKKFDGRAVVRNLSMQVKRGTIYGFLGPNGSGKTTTIRMLCGLLTPDEGDGTCLGYDIRTDTDKIKRHVGYMTQRFSLYADLSVRENLEFIGRIYGLDKPRAAARAAIARLGLTGREEQIAGELSGGWKQRLALGACTLSSPQLLLLDEPTAGVDPKARRDFWNEIHALAAEGLTVLVSTHYMDEAERCHEIAYIAYGDLLTHGTVEEVIAGSRLTTYVVGAKDNEALNQLTEAAHRQARRRHGGAVRHQPACRRARRGRARCRHRALSRAQGIRVEALGALARGRVHRADGQGAGQFPMTHVTPGHLMPAQAPRRSGNGFWRKTWAMLVKEFIQLKRDRVSFAMIIMIPLVQLMLFGYAINTTPRDLPTAVLLQEHSDVGRSILAALQNTRYFKVTQLPRNEAELDRLILAGKVLFAVEIPAGFERSVRRGERPALLISADATDPVASGSALSALGQVVQHALAHDHDIPEPGAPPFEIRVHARYNPAGHHPAQHRARPGRHHPDHDHADLHGAFGHPRDRARHHGEPALHADHAGRDHARQDHSLHHGRLRAGGDDHRHRRRAVRRADCRQPRPVGGPLHAVHRHQSVDRLHLLDSGAEPVAGHADVDHVLPAEHSACPASCFPLPACRSGRNGSASALPLTHYLRIVRGVMLKGATVADLHYDGAALLVLMLVAMTIAVTRFRRTLD